MEQVMVISSPGSRAGVAGQPLHHALSIDDGQLGVDEHIRATVGTGWVEELVVNGPVRTPHLEALVAGARLSGRRLRIAENVASAALPAPSRGEAWTTHPMGGWLLSRTTSPRVQRALKRTIDIVVAGAFLTLLSPILATIALAVVLTSPGPPFYPWRVLGRNGRPFTGYKFRTMVKDAHSLQRQLHDRNEMEGPVFKMTDDPRVVPLGRFLRKYSLDELPQLWSVLKGDMSLVGPRPVYPEEYRDFELWQMRKLSVTPGITCLWQVSGRNAISRLSEWVRLDLEYIDRWSLGLDLQILARTLSAVVRGTGR